MGAIAPGTQVFPVSRALRERAAIFWDFDGVIKESVSVKTEAYEMLFAPYGEEARVRVREHHERNGGMSRFDKVPLYLQWVGENASADAVTRCCARFSEAVMQAVIDSAWVPGAREYLETHHTRQWFAVVTATPQEEIEQILDALKVRRWFAEVHGAPTAKGDAIRECLARCGCSAGQALMIGDSESDYRGAVSAGVPFLLRRTPLNTQLQLTYTGPQCEDFLNG